MGKLTKSLIGKSFFVEPQSPRQRQYEALRAYFMEEELAKRIAERFGYSLGAFHVLCHKFRTKQCEPFFIESRPGPKFGPKRDLSRKRVVELRKKNCSVADIHGFLKDEGTELSTVSIWKILNEEGFGKLPRRRDEERPAEPRPEKAGYADIRLFSLAPREFDVKVAGVFLLWRIVAQLDVQEVPGQLDWYGSKMIPAANALLCGLYLKFVEKERKSHVMDLLYDGGAFSVGLNEFPKRAYLAEYSQRLTHEDNMKFLHVWVKRLRKHNIIDGSSLNLDFQSLPYFGEDPVVQKHYVSMRSRRQKAILVFLAQDAKSKIFCYSNADLRKGEESDEILRFIDFWKKQTGRVPPHLVFDSKVTTYENLWKINNMDIQFVTLQQRKENLIREIANISDSAWREIELAKVERKYRFPKVVDRKTSITGYEKPIRQVIVKDLGHELPTVILTNDEKISCSNLITRYALRMLIENSIADCVGFFHARALSCSVAMRIDFDVILTLLAQATYHALAKKLRGYENCGPEVLFRKFIDIPGKIIVGETQIEVRLNKRATNPILIASSLLNSPFNLPWIREKKIVITTR
jgi:hypothetical protein